MVAGGVGIAMGVSTQGVACSGTVPGDPPLAIGVGKEAGSTGRAQPTASEAKSPYNKIRNFISLLSYPIPMMYVPKLTCCESSVPAKGNRFKDERKGRYLTPLRDRLASRLYPVFKGGTLESKTGGIE